MGAEQSVPDQPDGIETESFDLPTPWDAANRVGEFLSWWGDGRIEPAVDSPEVLAIPPLFARDLQALINAQRAEKSKDAFAAVLGYQAAEKDVETLRWLHAEAVWLLKQHEAADLSDHRLAAAEATLDHVEDRVAALLDDYGFAHPDGLAEGLDMLSTAFQVGAWLHAEALGVAHHESDLADEWCADWERSEASRQAWAEEAMRLTSELTEYADVVFRSQASPVWPDLVSTPDVCACPPEGAVFPAPWTPPQCTVHLAFNPAQRVDVSEVPADRTGRLMAVEDAAGSVLPEGEAP